MIKKIKFNIKWFFKKRKRRLMINKKYKRELLEKFEIGIKINDFHPLVIESIRYYKPDNMYILYPPRLGCYIKLDKKSFDKSMKELTVIG